MSKSRSLFVLCLVLAIGAVAGAASVALAGKTTVTKVSMTTTVHAVLDSEGKPTGVFEGKVSLSNTGLQVARKSGSTLPLCGRGRSAVPGRAADA